MADEQGYNGWANYPTWNVALWINNDQGWQESVHEELRAAVKAHAEDEYDDGDRLPTISASAAGDILRESVESAVAFAFGSHDGILPASVAADLIGWALDSADWRELGAAFLRDLEEQS